MGNFYFIPLLIATKAIDSKGSSHYLICPSETPYYQQPLTCCSREHHKLDQILLIVGTKLQFKQG